MAANDDRRETVRRQTERLREFQSDPTSRQRPLERLAKRRREHMALPQVEILQGRGSKEVLASPGELLVESRTLSARAAALIRAAGYGSTPVECLEGLVLRVTQRGAGRRSPLDLLNDLTAADVNASLNYITPSRVVLKSESTPEAATAPAKREHEPWPDDAVPVPVAIIDTGIASRQRRDGWLHGLETPANRDPLDVLPTPNGYLDEAAGHGTFIAGVVRQLGPDVPLVIRRVLDTDGVSTELEVACAIVDVVDDSLEEGGKLVVNLSLGTESDIDHPPIALSVALALARALAAERGGELLFVAAAGNDGLDQPGWPAAFTEPDMVAVAATGLDGQPAPWSTHGDWVDCSTLGEAVCSTYVKGKEDPALDPTFPSDFGDDAWAWWTGTSFAAPQVAARIADIAARQNCSLADAKTQLFATATGTVPGYGALLTILG